MKNRRYKKILKGVRQAILPERAYYFDLEECRRIFVGGTGRSGTSFVASWLAKAANLYRVPLESKFISEGGGLAELIEKLTESWSPTGASLALRTFDHFMRARLTGFEEGEFSRLVFTKKYRRIHMSPRLYTMEH